MFIFIIISLDCVACALISLFLCGLANATNICLSNSQFLIYFSSCNYFAVARIVTVGLHATTPLVLSTHRKTKETVINRIESIGNYRNQGPHIDKFSGRKDCAFEVRTPSDRELFDI